MDLPLLSQMRIPAALSLLRGKKIKPEGIHIHQYYEAVSIDQNALENYIDFMGFDNNQPLTYLYILAQRAQLASMLQPLFTIAIPGLIHVENELEKTGSVDFNAPFDLQVKGRVDYKKTGSLIPIFEVDFMQSGKRVARCKSVYLAKRKQKKSSKKQNEVVHSMKPDFQECWALSADMGKKYARVSGDQNPIHTSTFFARLMGLKQPIVHGWYMVSRLCEQIERLKQEEVESIQVQFKNPVYLPSTSTFEFSEKNNNISFSISNCKSEKLCMMGEVR